MKRVVMCTASLALLVVGWAAQSGEAAVTRHKLTEIIPGTEVVNTTLLDTGHFDAHHNLNQDMALNWHRWEDAAVTRHHVDLPDENAHLGSRAMSVLPNYGSGSGSGYARLQKTNTNMWPNGVLQPDTRYVLSAYLWNFGTADNNMTARVDLTDRPNEPQLVLKWDDPDAAQGYFMYGSFSTNPDDPDYIGAGNEEFNPAVRVWGLNKVGYAGAASDVIALQIDNVFITPEADFVPPTLAPEPAALSLLGLGGLGMLRRRKH